MILNIILALFLANVALAEEIKILSWNVYMLPKPLKFSQQSLRIEKIPEALKDTSYDFMFFQEAFLPGFRREMYQKFGSRYPYDIYLNRKDFFWRPMGSGVFIMSKHPFKVIDQVYYKQCAKADCYASKGSMLIESSLPSGKKVQFAITHMQSGEEQGSIRLSQIDQLKKMLLKNAKAGVPQFLSGDLNIDVAEPEFQDGQAMLGMNHAPLLGDIDYTGGFDNDCFKIHGRSPEWIDHLWFKPQGRKIASVSIKARPFEYNYKGMNCTLSDHMAIEGSISLD